MNTTELHQALGFIASSNCMSDISRNAAQQAREVTHRVNSLSSALLNDADQDALVRCLSGVFVAAGMERADADDIAAKLKTLPVAVPEDPTPRRPKM